MKVRSIDVPGWREVMRLEDPGSRLTAFLAIHADPFGRSFGGIRIRRYADEAAALEDAKALARAMSYKLAFAGIEGGGAKMVMLDHPGLDRENAVRRVSEFVESLNGRYRCGGDLGFTARDEEILGSITQYSACPGLGDASSESVVLSMEGLLEAEGRALTDIHVAVQGAGSVGGGVVKRLRDAGAKVTVADVDPAKTDIKPDDIYDLEADIFSPCAVGGVLDGSTIPRLRVSAVVGAANNPLSSPEDVRRLQDREIIYIPDYVSNSGATIRGALGMLERDAEAKEKMSALRRNVRELVACAKESGKSPQEIADGIAERRMKEWNA